MEHPHAALLRALRRLSDGDAFQAERAAGEGLQVDSEHGGLRQLRGVCRHLLHRFREAVEDLEIATCLVPLDPMGLWCLADSYRETGGVDRCLEHLVWLMRRPDCPASLLLKAAQSLDRLGEENAALEAYGEAARRSPESAPAHFGLARIRARLGLPAEFVLAPLARASALAPADPFYRASLHAAQVALGDAEGARRSLLSTRIDEVYSPQVASSFARALDRAGDVAMAGAWWIRAIQLSGGRPA